MSDFLHNNGVVTAKVSADCFDCHFRNQMPLLWPKYMTRLEESLVVQRAANVPMDFEVDGKFAGYFVAIYVVIIRVKYNC